MLDPQDLREYTGTIESIMRELDSRDTFGALERRVRELGDAERELEAAGRALESVRRGGKIFTGLRAEGFDDSGRPRVVSTYMSAEDALKRYTKAKENHIKASNNYVKAEEAARGDVERLSKAITELGGALSAEAGEVAGLVMGVGVFIGDTITGIKTVQQVGVDAVGAVEKASIILGLISTATRLLQKISELGNNKAFKEYEAYAEKVKGINALTDSVNEYRMAVAEARSEESSWFAEDSLRNLRDWREYHNEVYKAYVDKATEAQATYRNESGGGWLTGAVNWVMGNLSALFWNEGWRDIWGQGGYKKGETAAIDNLRIETRKKSSGFMGSGIGGHSQKTEDLTSWARKQGLGELFDDKGMVNKELAQTILENYGNKLVGQTKETLEALVELRERYDEYMEQLHEYVSSLYEPIVDNMVDGLWEWLDSGKDALDSFREYASGTFRDIVSDMLRTLVLDKVVGSFSEDVSALYERYAERGLSEEELMREVAVLTEGLIGRYSESLPALEGILTRVTDMLAGAGIDIRDSEGDSGVASQSGRGGAYTAMSQDQGTKLEGLFTSIALHAASIDERTENVAERMAAAEGYLHTIAENTGASATAAKKIQELIERLERDGIKTR